MEKTEDLVAAAKRILSDNIVATLCTCDQNLCHANNIYYAVSDSFELIFVSDKDTQHAENIKKNSNVSVVVFNTPASYGQGHQGLQISGTCVQTSGFNLISGWSAYTKRFPVFATMVKNPKMIEEKIVKTRMYSIRIESIKILDVPTFGQGFHFIKF